MNKGRKVWKEMLAKAKASHTWELAVAGNNLQWNLYHLRKKHGYTQAELGKKIGLLQPHVWRHEAGWWPSMETLAKYAHAYKLNISDLLGEPMYFGKQDILEWDEKAQDYVRIGSVETTSSAHTVNTAINWSFKPAMAQGER